MDERLPVLSVRLWVLAEADKREEAQAANAVLAYLIWAKGQRVLSVRLSALAVALGFL